MSLEAMEKTLGKVCDILRTCGNFFESDWCNDNCRMWNECYKIEAVENIGKVVR